MFSISNFTFFSLVTPDLAEGWRALPFLLYSPVMRTDPSPSFFRDSRCWLPFSLCGARSGNPRFLLFFPGSLPGAVVSGAPPSTLNPFSNSLPNLLLHLQFYNFLLLQAGIPAKSKRLFFPRSFGSRQRSFFLFFLPSNALKVKIEIGPSSKLKVKRSPPLCRGPLIEYAASCVVSRGTKFSVFFDGLGRLPFLSLVGAGSFAEGSFFFSFGGA